MQTRLRNQLHAVALNEGVRLKKRLLRPKGRTQLESLALLPWASRRRHDLLGLLDQVNATIAELTTAIEQVITPANHQPSSTPRHPSYVVQIPDIHRNRYVRRVAIVQKVFKPYFIRNRPNYLAKTC